ncbi:hypothetical protein A8H26_22435 [Pluralibacter gergoviae]|nr:hypothetical protein A8H26_22435 [Pluralibacter gergoviae]
MCKTATLYDNVQKILARNRQSGILCRLEWAQIHPQDLSDYRIIQHCWKIVQNWMVSHPFFLSSCPLKVSGMMLIINVSVPMRYAL